MSSSTYALVLTLSLFSSCSGRHNDSVTPIETQRNGRSLANFNPQYIDESPSLSSNGLKLVFVSGRTGGVLRVFTTSRTAVGSGFSNVNQLSTSTGLNTEDNALLSPDGNYILIQGATADGRALVLCNFAGTTCTKVTTSPWGFNHYSFSPDSTLFFYLSGTSTAGGTLSTATVAAPTTPTTIGTTDHWFHAFWMPVASGYNIVAEEYASSTDPADTTVIGKANLVANTFASQGSTSTATTIVSNIAVNSWVDSGPLQTSGAATRFVVSNRITPSADNMFTELGNADTANPKKTPFAGEIHTYSASGTDEKAISQGGYTIADKITDRPSYMGSDGDTIFSLNNIAKRCTGEGDMTFGTALGITSKSANNTTLTIFKRKQIPTNGNPDKTVLPAIASDVCNKVFDQTTALIDLSTNFFAVNPGATATAYSIAWVSTLVGDPEIYVLDLASGTTTIVAPSANYVPVAP